MQNVLHFCQYSVCVCVRVCVQVCAWVCAVIPLLCLVSSLLFNRHCPTSQHNSLWLSVSYKPCSSNAFQFPKLVAYFEVWQAKEDPGKNFLGSVENVERDANTVRKRVTSLNWVIQSPLTDLWPVSQCKTNWVGKDGESGLGRQHRSQPDRFKVRNEYTACWLTCVLTTFRATHTEARRQIDWLHL